MRHYRVVLADVIAAHDEALFYGGRAGVLSIANLESAIGRPYSGYHRPIGRKAAALLHALVKNHGFVDGNKRTALLVTLLMIARSGYCLALASDDRLDDVVADVADDKMSFDELCEWMKIHLRKQA